MAIIIVLSKTSLSVWRDGLRKLRQREAIMFWCHDCAKGYEEDELQTDIVQAYANRGHGDIDLGETEMVCPDCGNDHLEEYEPCSVCGETDIDKVVYPLDGKNYCLECRTDLIVSKVCSEASDSIIANVMSLTAGKSVNEESIREMVLDRIKEYWS